MKRFWMLLLTISVVLVIALPAGAAKPDKGPKPPKAVPIAVSLDASPIWVHERADLISYTVTLENKTSNDINDVAVKLMTTDPDNRWDFPEDAVNGVVPANSSVGLNFYLYVSQFDEALGCEVGDECALLATAEVFINVTDDGDLLTGDLLTQVTMSTPLMPIASCGFVYDDDFIRSTNQVTVSDICIWTLPEISEGDTRTGVWGITLDPDLPDNPKRAISAGVTVRDGVPGNWCSMAVDGDWGFGERRWDGVSLIVGEVYLPGAEDVSGQGLGDGVCLAGGAGGEYFAVGNPDSFYLHTNGDVTVQWLGEDPSDWAWPVSNGED